MNLRIVLPARVLFEVPVTKVTAEATNGSFCLLPKHRDIVASLVPGILAYEGQNGSEAFVAISQGVLTKSGLDVLVSVRQAVRSEELSELHQVVRDDFQKVDERQRVSQTVMARLEADFMRRFLALEETPHV